jgi:predicted dehydrogenase
MAGSCGIINLESSCPQAPLWHPEPLMRFALLGDHPDGLDLARALSESGRHQLTVYSGPRVGLEYLLRWGLEVDSIGDLEEVLADPAVDALIVAGSSADRPGQLRRALQSERHVLCVHPVDQTPDVAYEAVLIQKDTGCVLLPLLPEALHPGIRRLAELTAGAKADSSALRLLQVERWSSEAVLLDADEPGNRPAVPGWDLLRRLGGEIAEVSAFTAGEEADIGEALLLSGRFEKGGLFQVTLVPQQSDPRQRLTILAGYSGAELIFPQGWPGPSRLTWMDKQGESRVESWESWDPWPALVAAFETALDRQQAGENPAGPLSWHDEVRCLELDDAARRSLARRRTSTLEYQIATEEVSFKGAMTLFGCSLLWAALALLILSVWVPWLGWFIIPLFGLFLVLQLLRWALPGRPQDAARLPAEPQQRAATGPQ